MTVAPQPGEGRAAPGEFVCPAEAEAWLGALQQTIGSIPRTEFAETIMRIERAYDAFPELAVAFPRRALFRHVRSVAAALPDAEAIPLLLLCAAAEPTDRASLAGLFERLARAKDGAPLLSAIALFRPYRDLGWEELGPAVAVLVERRAASAVILAIIGEILTRADDPPETVAELGRVLASRLFTEPGTAIDPAALGRIAAAARRRLAAAERQADGEVQRQLLSLAERLRARLQPPARPFDEMRMTWPSGEIGFASFIAQWPDLAIGVPAHHLFTSYAVLDADGMLRAERHAAGAFCYGPYLDLPAGRYRVGIIGEADAGAEYVAQVVHRPHQGGPAPICARRYVRNSRTVGVIAELGFANDIELRDFEIVVNVASASVAFAISAVTIEADRLRPDED
jgi:hypothetical protein